MTIKQIIGLLLVLSPFIALTIFMVKQSGWSVALGVWGIVVVILAVVVGGLHLLSQ